MRLVGEINGKLHWTVKLRICSSLITTRNLHIVTENILASDIFINKCIPFKTFPWVRVCSVDLCEIIPRENDTRACLPLKRQCPKTLRQRKQKWCTILLTLSKLSTCIARASPAIFAPVLILSARADLFVRHASYQRITQAGPLILDI